MENQAIARRIRREVKHLQDHNVVVTRGELIVDAGFQPQGRFGED